HGLMISSTAIPLCAIAALSSSLTCFGLPAKERATKVALETRASRQMSTGMYGFSPCFFSESPFSAVAENCPLVSPYTPLFSTIYTMFTLRRIRCLNCPIPMLAVSPSPETPSPLMVWSPNRAPVAIEGMRPCRLLKPKERFKKYVGLLLEHPMPLNLLAFSGSLLISYIALTIWFEIELCPQPWQRVVGLPR